MVVTVTRGTALRDMMNVGEVETMNTEATVTITSMTETEAEVEGTRDEVEENDSKRIKNAYKE